MLLVCALFGLVEVLVYPRAEWQDYLAEMVTAFTLRANVVLAWGCCVWGDGEYGR